MRKRGEDEDYEVVFVKKSLQFTLPSLGNMQERKNPFSKMLKLGTFRPGTANAPKAAETPIGHSYTMFRPEQKMAPHVVPQQVPHPAPPLTDVSDSVLYTLTSWLSDSDEDSEIELSSLTIQSGEESQSSLRSSRKIVGPKLPVPGGYYTVTLSKEVEYNFKQLSHVPSVLPSEIAVRSLNLSDSALKSKSSSKTLVLDLDDTLIHTIDPSFNYAAKGVKHHSFKNLLYQDTATGQIYPIKVLIRPYAMQLLNELSSIYEIVIFTAARKCYASSILGLLDPEGVLINHRLYRDRCIFKGSWYLKDLRILQNRSLSNVVIVDNSIISFANQLDNGIHVPTYYGQADDSSLLFLIPFLKSLADCKDIPQALEQRLALSAMYKSYLQQTPPPP